MQPATGKEALKLNNTDRQDARVLILDDCGEFRSLMRLFLNSIGITEVSESSNANVALEKLKDFEFDLIFTDLHMPGKDGIEFVWQLRQGSDYLNQDIPVIFLTSEASKAAVLEAARCGIDGYLIKPVTPNDVCVRLDQILTGKRPVFKKWIRTGGRERGIAKTKKTWVLLN